MKQRNHRGREDRPEAPTRLRGRGPRGLRSSRKAGKVGKGAGARVSARRGGWVRTLKARVVVPWSISILGSSATPQLGAARVSPSLGLPGPRSSRSARPPSPKNPRPFTGSGLSNTLASAMSSKGTRNSLPEGLLKSSRATPRRHSFTSY